MNDLLFSGIRQQVSLNDFSSKPFTGLLAVLPQTFYALRHTACIIAGSSKDKDARSYFAGNAWSGPAEIYNEDFDDHRLVVIGQLIDKWLGINPTGG